MISPRLTLSVWLLAFGSLIAALNLSHWVLPDGGGLTAMTWPVNWIEPNQPVTRAYYRYTLDVPFQPLWAWVSVAAADQELYVNGRVVESNHFTEDSSWTLLHRVSDPAQGLTPFAPSVSYKAELRRAANEEWRFPLHTNINAYLHPGRNVLALFTENPSLARFAIQGEIVGDGQHVVISSNARDWRVSPTYKRIGDMPWYQPALDVVDWRPARPGPPVTNPLYAPAPPAIWELPMPQDALTGPAIAGDLRFQLDVPGVGPAQRETSWVRVYSNWLYYLFLDDQLIGRGGGISGAEAWDLTSYQHSPSQRLSLRLVAQTDPNLPHRTTEPNPFVVVDGLIGGRRISTDSDWKQVVGTYTNWLSGEPRWTSVDRVPQELPPNNVVFQYPNELGASWYAKFALLWLACGVGLSVAYFAVRLLERLFGESRASAGGAALWILSLAVLGLALTELLHMRFFTTDSLLMFIRPENRLFLQALGPLLLAGAIVAYQTTPAGEPGAWRQRLLRHWPTIAMVAIILLAVGLRLYRIGFEDLQDDENVSWDAARGILHTGLPLETSKIFYTRSVLYHFALAGWLAIFGDTKTSARLFSVIPGVLAIWLTYRLTLYVSGGRRVVALLVALLLAIDPWELRNSQDIRFYQQVQTFSVAAMWAFLLGFVDRRGKAYQNTFFFLASAACFSQEVFVLAFPGFCVAGFYFYRPWRWRENINVCVGFAFVLGLVIYDIIIFEIMTLTANIGISSSSAPALLLHLWNPTVMPSSFFLGYLEDRLVYFVFFSIGLVYWLRRSNRYVGTLYIQIICGIITATILVVQIEDRYVYLFYPFLVVTAAVTVDAILQDFARVASAFAEDAAQRERLRRRWVACAGGLCAVAALISMEPRKVWQSFHWRINTQQESGFQFVLDHRRPGDVVLANTPDAAATVTHGLDLYITNVLFFDALYQPGNEIVERWAGGRLLSNVDMLRQELLRHDRIWLVLSDNLAKSYTDDWQDLLASAETKYEWFGGRVALWERNKGGLQLTPDKGGASNGY